ncbi:MAG: cobalamin biosynthesis protein, partial [Cyanobacteriota bacterium]|nr:cobalamin biosynthesis protein [Cyanobacteriota bacterium]
MPNLFQPFHPLAAIATTPAATRTLEPLCQASGATLWLPSSDRDDPNYQFPITNSPLPIPHYQLYPGSLKEQLALLWPTHRALIFCMAAGAVVRLLAPLLRDKASDPAVVVLDSDGRFVISLCGGHQGGADRLAQLVARQLGATPVITGASAGLGLPGVDVLGLPFGWKRGAGDWTAVSAAIASQKTIQVVQEAGSTLWQQHLPQKHPFVFEEREMGSRGAGVQGCRDAGETGGTGNGVQGCRGAGVQGCRGENYELRITHSQFPIPHSQFPIPNSQLTVCWHPRVLWVGMGCERGTSRDVMEAAIAQVFEQFHLAEAAIAGIATIDLKADEVGFLELCRDRDWPLKTFRAEPLRSLEVPTPSQVVEREVGTPSVAEAAAILASETLPFGASKVEGFLRQKSEGKE